MSSHDILFSGGNMMNLDLEKKYEILNSLLKLYNRETMWLNYTIPYKALLLVKADIQKPYPPLEAIISMDAACSLHYALWILDDRFKLGERRIINSFNESHETILIRYTNFLFLIKKLREFLNEQNFNKKMLKTIINEINNKFYT